MHHVPGFESLQLLVQPHPVPSEIRHVFPEKDNDDDDRYENYSKGCATGCVGGWIDGVKVGSGIAKHKYILIYRKHSVTGHVLYYLITQELKLRFLLIIRSLNLP